MTDLTLYEVDLDTQRPNPFNSTQVLKGDSPRTAFTKYNDALQALHGSIRHVGPLAPSPTVPYMQWTDTSTNPPTNRMRNAANTAWIISVGTVGIQIKGRLPDEASLPASAVNGDAYVIDNHMWVWAGGEWVDVGPIVGPQGDVGPQGVKGDTGIGLNFVAELTSEDDLPTDPFVGDGYTIGGVLFVWNGDYWADMGQFKGDKGDRGEDGTDGVDGLKGDKGDKGDRGEKGDSGNDGVDGIDGERGKSAYEVAVDAGFPGSEAEWLESLKAQYPRVQLTDYSDARFAYLGYADRICRVDYNSFPAQAGYAQISDLSSAWANRASLTYV